MASSYPRRIPICDPHFHVWDVKQSANPNLGGIADTVLGTYTAAEYKRDFGDLPFKSCAHVEAIVGQIEGEYKLDIVGETAWVLKNAAQLSPIKTAVVPFVHLGREDAEATLEGHRALAGKAFVGVRMILNYNPTDPTLCWPQVGRDDYLKGTVPLFKENFALLAKHNLSFELHCNWEQLKDAATFLAAFPDTVVIVDHLGCAKLGRGEETDAKTTAEWQEGMTALAALPNTYVKISCFDYIAGPEWIKPGTPQHDTVKGMTKFALSLWGLKRSFFASNFPVDKHTSGALIDLPTLYDGIYSLIADAGYTDDELTALFHDNAARVYKIDSL